MEYWIDRKHLRKRKDTIKKNVIHMAIYLKSLPEKISMIQYDSDGVNRGPPFDLTQLETLEIYDNFGQDQGYNDIEDPKVDLNKKSETISKTTLGCIYILLFKDFRDFGVALEPPQKPREKYFLPRKSLVLPK